MTICFAPVRRFVRKMASAGLQKVPAVAILRLVMRSMISAFRNVLATVIATTMIYFAPVGRFVPLMTGAGFQKVPAVAIIRLAMSRMIPVRSALMTVTAIVVIDVQKKPCVLLNAIWS